MSATILANAAWLDTHAVSNHRLAGILTLAVLVALGTLSGTALFSNCNKRAMSARVRNAVLLLAVAGFGDSVDREPRGALRHSELASDEPGSMESPRTR